MQCLEAARDSCDTRESSLMTTWPHASGQKSIGKHEMPPGKWHSPQPTSLEITALYLFHLSNRSPLCTRTLITSSPASDATRQQLRCKLQRSISCINKLQSILRKIADLHFQGCPMHLDRSN
ncbi:hypothetical protein AVEN_172752-1 [Araneus ventricosus]|uniref:Uncharacterized protein n=1 Tax=Araneus ventricosus TaxID=182803 RepID=A0A4Y2BID6_ARAVE|nr:hypothetical protein AVEN_172752-1 [Araneus ventricosus]